MYETPIQLSQVSLFIVVTVVVTLACYTYTKGAPLYVQICRAHPAQLRVRFAYM